jgi:hypothetical protein
MLEPKCQTHLKSCIWMDPVFVIDKWPASFTNQAQKSFYTVTKVEWTHVEVLEVKHLPSDSVWKWLHGSSRSGLQFVFLSVEELFHKLFLLLWSWPSLVCRFGLCQVRLSQCPPVDAFDKEAHASKACPLALPLLNRLLYLHTKPCSHQSSSPAPLPLKSQHHLQVPTVQPSYRD